MRSIRRKIEVREHVDQVIIAYANEYGITYSEALNDLVEIGERCKQGECDRDPSGDDFILEEDEMESDEEEEDSEDDEDPCEYDEEDE